jgi:hypothetical protein
MTPSMKELTGRVCGVGGLNIWISGDGLEYLALREDLAPELEKWVCIGMKVAFFFSHRKPGYKQPFANRVRRADG